MTLTRAIRPLLVCGTTLLVSAGCAFHGINSLPLPGTAGRGPGATTYHVQLSNVGTLEPNSPVLIRDVIVGSVGYIKARNWHADVDISIKPGITVPANAVATVGQTSLLGSMHLALNPPPGQAAAGRLQPGATIPLNRSSTYPSTEQTLSSLSLFINVGGAAQIGDIIRNVDDALHGREDQIRDALTRLDTFLAVFDRQRDKITNTIDGLDRLAATLAAQTDTIDHALHDIPPALDVLTRERPRLTAALDKLGSFSAITTRLIHDSQNDLVTNLRNLEPALGALADVGPHLDAILAYVSVFPFGQNVIDRAVRGDYLNLYAVIDLTLPRLKRTLLRGTRWEDLAANLVPAPGDPYYLNHTLDPLGAPLALPPPDREQSDPVAPVPHPPSPTPPSPEQPSTQSDPDPSRRPGSR
jgi:phospholipid/cholesterol/gamma-HCH transport system substrate-binding protein